MAARAAISGFARMAGSVLVIGLATIIAALAMQHIGGLIPCDLCLKQRWPYYAALPLTAFALLLHRLSPIAARGLMAPVGMIFLAGALLAFYHAGVEYGLWPGPASCAQGAQQSFDTINQLMQALDAGELVRCDEAAFTLFGISLAGYNGLVCLLLAGLGFMAAFGDGKRKNG
jgi:disulfide bond formation protein DsbB